MKISIYKGSWLIFIGLWCSGTMAASTTQAIQIFDTQDQATLSISIDSKRYNNLLVKSRIVKPANSDRNKIPMTDAYTQYTSDGVYQLRLPESQLSMLPKGYYLLVYDAYASGIIPSDPPLQTRKIIYVKVTDVGARRIEMKQFVLETQQALAEVYAEFSNHFNGTGIADTGGSTTSNSSDSDSECCTDVDVDIPEGPDVDVDGPGGTPGGDTPGDDVPGGDTPGGDVPGGETPGDNPPGGDTGGEWDPEDDPLYDIWDCWENGNCDDDTDTGSDGETGDTGGGDTGDTGGPFDTGPTDSGPML